MPEGQQQSFIDQTACLEESGSEGGAEEYRDSCHEPEVQDIGSEEICEPPMTRRRIHEIGNDLMSAEDSRTYVNLTDQRQTPTESRGDSEPEHHQHESGPKVEEKAPQGRSDIEVTRERSRTPPKVRVVKPSVEEAKESVAGKTEYDQQALMALQKDCLVFLAYGRMALPAAKMFESQNEKKEKRGNTLCYEKENKGVREGLDASRRE